LATFTNVYADGDDDDDLAEEQTASSWVGDKELAVCYIVERPT